MSVHISMYILDNWNLLYSNGGSVLSEQLSSSKGVPFTASLEGKVHWFERGQRGTVQSLWN